MTNIREKRRRWIEADIGWYRGSAKRLRNSGSFHLDLDVIWVIQDDKEVGDVKLVDSSISKKDRDVERVSSNLNRVRW